MKIALLSTINSPYLSNMLGEFKKSGIEVGAILMDSKELSQRDLNRWQERTGGWLPRESLAKYSHIPVHFFHNHNWQRCFEFAKQYDVLINAGTPRLLNSEILGATKYGVVNCHPSLLPNYRGACAIEWALYNGEKLGNTVHIMGEELDSGLILQSEEVSWSVTDTYTDIFSRVYLAGWKLLAYCVQHLPEGEYRKVEPKPILGVMSDNQQKELKKRFRVLCDHDLKTVLPLPAERKDFMKCKKCGDEFLIDHNSFSAEKRR